MYSKSVRQFAKKYQSKSANAFIRLTESVSLLKKETKWLDELNPSLKFRILCVVNNLEEIPKCKHCNNNTSIEKSYKLSFNKFCSEACRKNYRKKETISNRKNNKKLNDSDWLYSARIEKRMSLENIADILNVPVYAVKEHIKKYNIPEVKYNESDSLTRTILSSKEKMKELYESKDIRTIADEFGVSNYCIWYWLRKHNIEPKASNGYPRKVKKISNEEEELVNFLREIYNGEIITSDRSLLKGSEIDIVIPDLKMCFEYNGLYWHSEKYKDKNYHSNKTKEAKKQGYTLYHIFSDDWNLKNKIWKSRIKHLLGVTEHKIYARKCVVKEISSQIKNKFLEENHLQGKDKSSFRFGLFFNNELVAVMTFGKSRFNRNIDWELVRYACLNNHSIVGGFSKLLTAARKKLKNGTIVTYADNSYSDGNVYLTNGFVAIASYPAGYKYTKDMMKRENRLNFTKQRLKAKYKDKNFAGMTEKDICESLGYTRIWDCGTTTYVLDNSI